MTSLVSDRVLASRCTWISSTCKCFHQAKRGIGLTCCWTYATLEHAAAFALDRRDVQDEGVWGETPLHDALSPMCNVVFGHSCAQSPQRSAFRSRKGAARCSAVAALLYSHPSRAPTLMSPASFVSLRLSLSGRRFVDCSVRKTPEGYHKVHSHGTERGASPLTRGSFARIAF